MHAHDKIQVHKRLLYRVKSSIKSEDNHTYSDEFYKLEPWAQQFNELNPTSLARIVWDGDDRFWTQNSFPCVHAIAANNVLKFKDTLETWYKYSFDSIYLLSSYELTYGQTNPGIDPPLVDDVTPESKIGDLGIGVTRLPPLIVKTIGRKQKKRKRKRTEKDAGQPVKVYKCSICKSTEHNSRC